MLELAASKVGDSTAFDPAGPTGSGKTLVARTLARLVDVPFTIADATCLTQAGYVGEDVESILYRLYLASGQDIEATQAGRLVRAPSWQRHSSPPWPPGADSPGFQLRYAPGTSR